MLTLQDLSLGAMSRFSKTLLDWKFEDSLRRRCYISLAGVIASHVDSLIVKHIFSNEYNLEELISHVRSYWNNLTSSDLPSEITSQIADCVSHLSSSAGFVLSCIISPIQEHISTTSRCSAFPLDFTARCVSVLLPGIRSLELQAVEFSDEILLALARSRSAATLEQLGLSTASLSTTSETCWLRFEALSTLIINESAEITQGGYENIARSNTLSILKIRQSFSDFEVFLGPQSLPNLTVLQTTEGYNGSMPDYKALLPQRPNLDLLERLPYSYPVCRTDQFRQEEIVNLEMLNYLLDTCPNIDPSPAQWTVFTATAVKTFPERLLRAMKQPRWRIAVESDEHYEGGAGKAATETFEILRRFHPNLLSLELQLPRPVTLNTIDLSAFTELCSLFVVNLSLNINLILPEPASHLTMLQIHPLAASDCNGDQTERRFNKQFAPALSKLTELRKLYLQSNDIYFELADFDLVIKSLTKLEALSFRGRTKTDYYKEPTRPVYLLSHPNLRQWPSITIDTPDHILAGHMPCVISSRGHRLWRLANSNNSQLQQIDIAYNVDVTAEEAQNDSAEFGSFPDLRTLDLQFPVPVPLTSLVGLRNLETLSIRGCQLPPNLHESLLEMPWLTQLTLSDVTLDSLKFLRHPLLRQLTISGQVKPWQQPTFVGLVLNTSTLPQLRTASISLFESHLDHLVIENLPFLIDFHYYSTGGSIRELTVRNCSKLVLISIHRASIAQIEVENCPRLGSLSFIACGFSKALERPRGSQITLTSPLCRVRGLPDAIQVKFSV